MTIFLRHNRIVLEIRNLVHVLCSMYLTVHLHICLWFIIIRHHQIFSSAFDLQRGYHTDHSSADESGQDDPSGLNEPVTSPPVSSPSCSSLKSGGSANSNSKQGSPRGSTLHIPATASGKRPQLKRTRKKSSKSSSCALKTSGSNEIEAKDSV